MTCTRRMLLLALLVFTCCPAIRPRPVADRDAMAGPRLSPAIQTLRSGFDTGERGVSNFYVALKAIPGWQPDSRADCVDRSLWAWARKWLGGGDDAHLALLATITMPDGTSRPPIAIFSVAKRESGHDEPQCDSVVVEGLLTERVRADRLTAFTIELVLRSGRISDIGIARRLGDRALELAGISGTAAWLAGHASLPGVGAFARSFDQSVASHLRVASSDTYARSLQIFPDSSRAPDDGVDGLALDLGEVIASRGGLAIQRPALPYTRIQIAYTNSLFATQGHYPSADAILSSNLGARDTPDLGSRLNSGLGGVSRAALMHATTREQMDTYCTILRAELAWLTPDDGLAARFSILKRYTAYDELVELRSPRCFDGAELTRLQQLNPDFGFALAEGVEARELLADDQRVDVVCALVGAHGLQVHHVAHGAVVVDDAVGTE